MFWKVLDSIDNSLSYFPTKLLQKSIELLMLKSQRSWHGYTERTEGFIAIN